ncbi:CPBP family intramembrane glutamic endopeptidase [Pontivivens ytuae]|uniref:CPBP family intramembrane metalloprotease n=1 Tax=Pontivivens ytuae TaxID=2789856 RepID=A0A7S9LTJ8_9RHOB|nr:CPBP family intramembrane glutamic endopeptidase [Pontivivens ytuae]QPH54881.1 CPBP family intramembrane metalloprotease [Pontivivens ytuae]
MIGTIDGRRARLWAELIVLFGGVPLLLALALPPTAMWTVLGVTTGAGLVLLHVTPGFSWSELGKGGIDWRATALFTLATVVVATAMTLWLMPEMLFFLPQNLPQLWLTILLFYPFVSALPQEVIFRPLFFRRYGHLFPEAGLIWVNAALFSLAHLMYRDPVVLGMTFCGGLAFAWAYHRRGSFWTAVIMHALAGGIVFTVGLGRLFYSGAVGN